MINEVCIRYLQYTKNILKRKYIYKVKDLIIRKYHFLYFNTNYIIVYENYYIFLCIFLFNKYMQWVIFCFSNKKFIFFPEYLICLISFLISSNLILLSVNNIIKLVRKEIHALLWPLSILCFLKVFLKTDKINSHNSINFSNDKFY